MENQKGKSFYLIFVLALGFTVYYAFSVYRGNLRMASYEDARRDNEISIGKLDSLIALTDEKGYTEKEINNLADQRESAYHMRDVIKNNKIVGSGVYHRRLLKLYLGLGVMAISFGMYQYLKRRKGGTHQAPDDI